VRRLVGVTSVTGLSADWAIGPDASATFCGETDVMTLLSPDLVGPVGLELARAVEKLPGVHGMPGGSRYESKWDGFLH
jgi:hypothetical protein